MRCVKCGFDVGLRARARGRNCPHCGQGFVTEPTLDGVTDTFVENAARAVSGHGTFQYLRRQLSYEIERRCARRTRREGAWALVLLALAAAVGWVAWVRWLELLVAAGLLVVFANRRWQAAARFQRAGLEANDLARRWHRVHADPLLLQPRQGDRSGSQEEEPADLGDASFHRVLVCDRPEYVDFFLANDFHFHYSCPVLGGKGYPPEVFPDMIARLKKNPGLAVYVVHDFTPSGLQFARQVRHDKSWFGDHPKEQLYDLGLTASQTGLFRRLQRPLKEIDPPGAATRAGQGLEEGNGAELTIFRPRVLIRMVAHAMAEDLPFHRLPRRSSRHLVTDGDGYG